MRPFAGKLGNAIWTLVIVVVVVLVRGSLRGADTGYAAKPSASRSFTSRCPDAKRAREKARRAMEYTRSSRPLRREEARGRVLAEAGATRKAARRVREPGEGGRGGGGIIMTPTAQLPDSAPKRRTRSEDSPARPPTCRAPSPQRSSSGTSRRKKEDNEKLIRRRPQQLRRKNQERSRLL